MIKLLIFDYHLKLETSFFSDAWYNGATLIGVEVLFYWLQSSAILIRHRGQTPGQRKTLDVSNYNLAPSKPT